MKILLSVLVILFLLACGKGSNSTDSIEIITEQVQQEIVFRNLITVTNSSINESTQQDSLAFLVLPVQASCPACRKKTIDSIAKHQGDLADRHFIIISANGGHKAINSYFLEQDHELPVMENKLFLDSTNQASKYDLYKDKPTIYYTYREKAYKKVAAIPATVREDLREFFSGYREK